MVATGQEPLAQGHSRPDAARLSAVCSNDCRQAAADVATWRLDAAQGQVRRLGSNSSSARNLREAWISGETHNIGWFEALA